MRERKTLRDAEKSPTTVMSSPRSRKKPRPPRVRLTHLEVRRGDALRLRIAVADDAMAEVGDELGALIKKIAPSTRTTVIEASQPVARTESQPNFIISRQHADDDDGDAYHADLREHLSELFSSLCDTALADALKIAREECARRAEGSN